MRAVGAWERCLPTDTTWSHVVEPCREKVRVAEDAYERLALHEALEALTAVCARGNQYLEETQPWKLLKVRGGEAGVGWDVAVAAAQGCGMGA